MKFFVPERICPFGEHSDQIHDSTAAVRAIPRLRKAVIPAAGLGTRLFPATRATKKEFFPIIDRDGIAKPVILLIVEEALQAGLEEVIVIVQEGDLDDFRAFFDVTTMAENYHRLPPHLQEYSRRIQEMGRCVSFAIQRTQEGFGHAVYSARETVDDEPFLLMLGDHLYHSNDVQSCASQLLKVYYQHGLSVLGLRHVPESEIVHYGTAAGTWMEAHRLLNVTEFTEKPSVDYARTNLRVSGLPAGEYLAFFGQYIIKPQVFDYLKEHIANDVRERGEFQLTSALDRLREGDGFLGLVMDGQCYDVGLPESYLKTVQKFGQE